jgi:DNA-binding NtrC family response regulator
MSQDLRQTRIFVVDDESVISDTLGVILRQRGFDARSFDLPAEALRAAREQAPDLLIADVVMPVLSGIDLALQVREHYPGCKVLLFSGHPATADLLQVAREAGHEFEALAKPVHPAELVESVRTLIDA